MAHPRHPERTEPPALSRGADFRVSVPHWFAHSLIVSPYPFPFWGHLAFTADKLLRMNEMIYALATINLNSFRLEHKAINLLKLLGIKGCQQSPYFTLSKADVHSVKEKEKGTSICVPNPC